MNLKKHISAIQKNQSTSQDDIFMKPDPTKVTGMRHGSYDKLNDRGFVPEETKIENGDIIIGKVSPIQPVGNSNKTFKDNSEIYRSHAPAVIDKVYTNIYNSDGYEMRKVRTRSERIPRTGDKFCSRHGQKGTIGLTLKQSDMPFTKYGVVPDICLNPHAIPSRMTIAQLIETLMGKKVALDGTEADGTPFNKIDEKVVEAELEKLGYKGNGYEYLYNGMTGEKTKVMICIGPTYYQRLKHQVEDKIHCLTMDHEVLTIDGWKTYHQLSMNDLVATLDNGELKYTKPLGLLHFPNYKGQLYNIETPQISLRVTDNHRMWVSEEKNQFGLVQAKDVYGKLVRYQKNAKWNKQMDSNLEMIYENKIDEFISNNKNDNLPEWVFELNTKQSRLLLDKLIENPHDHLLDDIMRLCLHTGLSANIVNNKISINVDDGKPFASEKIYGHREFMEDYEGEVFCLQVPSEIFYVRRNGKGVWTGNSRSRGPRTLLTHQPSEGRSRDGGQLRLPKAILVC